MSNLDRAILAIVMVYVVVTAAIPYLYGTYVAPFLFLAACALVVTRRISGIAAVWTAALVVVGGAGAALGFLHHNPGARPTLTIFVIEPLVLGLLLGSIRRVRGWREWVVAALDGALLACVVLGLALYLTSRAGVSMPSGLVDPAHSFADTSVGVLRTNFQGFNALVFLAPWGLARFFWRLPGDKAWWNHLLGLAALVGIGLAGRRILFLTVPAIGLAAFLVCGIVGWRHLRERPKEVVGFWATRLAAFLAVLVVAWVVVAFAAGLDPRAVVERTTTQVGLTVGQTTGSLGQEKDSLGQDKDRSSVYATPDLRGVESAKMFDWWKKSPIWGHGSGSVVPGYTRNSTQPWIYELTYHNLLFQFGVLGCAVLAAWVLWMGRWLLRGVTASDALAFAMACALAGAVLASVTDPYLLKIDGMWMVFLPFGVAVAQRAAARSGDVVRAEEVARA